MEVQQTFKVRLLLKSAIVSFNDMMPDLRPQLRLSMPKRFHSTNAANSSVLPTISKTFIRNPTGSTIGLYTTKLQLI